MFESPILLSLLSGFAGALIGAIASYIVVLMQMKKQARISYIASVIGKLDNFKDFVENLYGRNERAMKYTIKTPIYYSLFAPAPNLKKNFENTINSTPIQWDKAEKTMQKLLTGDWDC